MNVRLPDGTVIQNVPDGTTRSQLIQKLEANGYDVSALKAEVEPAPATRTTVAEAIPFIPGETRQELGQTVRQLRAGATQALMTPAQITGAAPMLGLPARGAQTEAYLREVYGVDPTTTTAKVGQIGTEVALGMPIVRAAGAALGAASPAFGQAVRTGGFEIPAAVQGAKGIGLRAAGGGTAAVVGTAPFSPEDVMMAGPLGAVLAPVFRLGLGAARSVKGMLTPAEQIAENALLSAAGAEGVNALRATQGMRTTPGYVPSVSERVVEGGVENIALAALQDRIKRAPQAAQIQFDAVQKNMGYLRGQLDRIEQQIAQEGTQLAPADLTRLSEVRNNLQRQIAGEEQNLNALMTSLRGELPAKTVYPEGAAPGEVIQSRAEALRRRMRAQEVQPAYAAAFNAAEGAQIDVTPIADAARAALGRPLAEFAPESAPAIARALAPLQPTPTAGLIIGPNGRPLTTGVELPTMSLEQLDALRKAINSDIASAQRSMAGLTPAQAPDLYALHRQIDEVISNATNLSDEAKQLYGTALETYRTRFKPAFKDNVTGRLLKDSAFGETRILPENTVAAYFKDPTDTRQFLTTFGQDPQARAAFTRGIQDMFRDAVIDPVTMRVRPDAAATFLQKHSDKLQLLEQNGVPVRQQLDRIQTEAARLTQGLDEIGSLRGVYGQENPQDIVQSLLRSPAQMSDALRRLSPDGREAIQASVVQRVTNMISGDKPDIGAAVKLLAENSGSIKQVMGRSGFADLEALVERAGQVRKVAAEFQRSLPDARVQPKVQQIVGNFSREDLTDLSSVAADIARFQRAEGLAARGEAASRPSAQRLATEAAEETSPIRGYNPLDQATQLALRVSRHLEQRINDKAATELAVLMYQKPDEALAAMQRALARKERRTMFSGAAGRATAVAVPPVAAPVVSFSED
jgi:hypothetical protein